MSFVPMSQKEIKWLSDQLPVLVARGILTEDISERLKSHYGMREQTEGKRWAVILFGVLGAVLIGGGVILLIAHNWDELSRPARAVLSFLPLLCAQGLAWFALTKRQGSAAWREGTGAYWSLVIGATIGLIAQTYNISGDFGSFMLTWSLLGLPIVYLMQARFAAALYAIGITLWAGDAMDNSGHPAGFWVLAALIIPFYLGRLRKDRDDPSLALVGWTLSICVCIATSFMRIRYAEQAWIDSYALALPTLYVGGLLVFDSAKSLWKRPFQIVGGKGLVIFLVVLTFEDSWKHWHDNHYTLPVILWAGLPLTATVLSASCLRFGKPWHAAVAAAPAVVMLGKLLRLEISPLGAMVVCNLYLAALGVIALIAGIRTARLSLVNVGLGVLAVLIVTRFFDSDLSFIVRGVAFIIVGSAFLATNLLLTRKKEPVR